MSTFNAVTAHHRDMLRSLVREAAENPVALTESGVRENLMTVTDRYRGRHLSSACIHELRTDLRSRVRSLAASSQLGQRTESYEPMIEDIVRMLARHSDLAEAHSSNDHAHMAMRPRRSGRSSWAGRDIDVSVGGSRLEGLRPDMMWVDELTTRNRHNRHAEGRAADINVEAAMSYAEATMRSGEGVSVTGGSEIVATAQIEIDSDSEELQAENRLLEEENVKLREEIERLKCQLALQMA